MLLQEHARLRIYDPKVTEEQVWLDFDELGISSLAKSLVTIHTDAYDACLGSDAIVVLTEWDEFRTLAYDQIYSNMKKPACVFDGRRILNVKKLSNIGFQVEQLGQGSLGSFDKENIMN